MVERGQILLIAFELSSPLLIECLTQAKDYFAAGQTLILVSSLDSPYSSFAQSLHFLWRCPFLPSSLWSHSLTDYSSALYSGSGGFRIAILASETVQTIGQEEGWGKTGQAVLAEVHYRERNTKILRQYESVDELSTFLVSLPTEQPACIKANAMEREQPWARQISRANDRFKRLLAASSLPSPFPPLSHQALASLTSYIHSVLLPALAPSPVLFALSHLISFLRIQLSDLQQALTRVSVVILNVEQRVRGIAGTWMKGIEQTKRRVEGLERDVEQGRTWLRREMKAKEKKQQQLFVLGAVKTASDAVLLVQVTPRKQYKVPCNLIISTDSGVDKVIHLATAVARKVRIGHMSEFQADFYHIQVKGENSQPYSNLLTVTLSPAPPPASCFLSSHIGNLFELEHCLLSSGVQALQCFRFLAERWVHPEMHLVERLIEEAKHPEAAQERLEALGFQFD